MPIDFIVPPLSWKEIEDVALDARRALGLETEAWFPIIEVLEKVLDRHFNVRLDVGDYDEMGEAEGLTSPDGTFIMLREDVYRGVCANEPRARFTAAHELGHLELHTNIPMARAPHRESVPIYRLAEPQANQFAAAILMPETFVQPWDDADALMLRFGVSFEAARNRLSNLRKRGKI